MKTTVVVFFVMLACVQGSRKYWEMGSDDIVVPNGIDQYGYKTHQLMRWPDKTVPYVFDLVEKFTDDQKAVVMKAMELVSKVSCIKFKSFSQVIRDFMQEWTTEKGYINIQYLKNRGSCWSLVGYQAKPQNVLLSDKCIRIIYSSVHELLHALGFAHEQSRYDRDIYLELDFEKMGVKKDSFEKISRLDSYTPFGYDHQSVTHYHKFDHMVLRGADETKQLEVGQREMMSPKDIDKLKYAYNCVTEVTQ